MNQFKFTEQNKLDIKFLESVLKGSKFRKETRLKIIRAILPWIMVRDEDVIPERFYFLGTFRGIPMYFDTKESKNIYGTVDRVKEAEEHLKNVMGMNNVREDATARFNRKFK